MYESGESREQMIDKPLWKLVSTSQRKEIEDLCENCQAGTLPRGHVHGYGRYHLYRVLKYRHRRRKGDKNISVNICYATDNWDRVMKHLTQ